MSDELPQQILYVSAVKFSQIKDVLERPAFGVGGAERAVLEVAKMFDPPLVPRISYKIVVNDWSIPTQ